MKLPVALQLYTLRNVDLPFADLVKNVARMGYLGVETAGIPEGYTAAKLKSLLDEYGLQVCASHSPLPLGDDKNQVIETTQALGNKRLVCPSMPRDKFSTLEDIKWVCDQLNQANEVAKENQLKFGYHNHWWEFQMVNDRPAIAFMLEYLSADIFFEVDTYWVYSTGFDPAEWVAGLGERAQLLHIKDGPEKYENTHFAVGDGCMDFANIIKKNAGHAEWLVVELDQCETDVLTTVEKSIQYLQREGLGRGK